VRRDPAWTAIGLLALMTMALFLVWPLVTTFASSFHGKDGGYGFNGYVTFFTARAYRDSLWNTLIFIASAPVGIVIALGLALLVSSRCWSRAAGFRSRAGSRHCRW